MKNNYKSVIAVCGDSDAGAPAMETAQELGKGIAAQGWHLICGGGTGVMEAACRGFAESRDAAGVNVVSIGVLPSDDVKWANAYIDVPVATGMGYARNAIIVQTATVVCAIGGRSGTLSEIAFAWQFNKPIVALKTGSGWADRLAGQQIDERRSDIIHEADNAGQALEIINEIVNMVIGEKK